MDMPENLIPYLHRGNPLCLPTWLSRFDFVLDDREQLRMVEINADTPCFLIESYYANGVAARYFDKVDPNIDAYNELGKDGSEVLAIVLSDVLSGTYETASSAADMVDTKVTVINSKSTDRGLAFQVLAAAKDLEAGKSIDEIKDHLKDIYHRTTIDVLIDNLDCLVAGGRVSRLAGALTKLINLKLIIRLNEESLDVIVKGRSKKTFIKHCKTLAEEYLQNHNPIQALSLSNVGTDDSLLQKIKDTLLENNSIQEIPYIARLTSPIIMTHTGLNAVGVITLNEKPTH